MACSPKKPMEFMGIALLKVLRLRHVHAGRPSLHIGVGQDRQDPFLPDGTVKSFCTVSGRVDPVYGGVHLFIHQDPAVHFAADLPDK